EEQRLAALMLLYLWLKEPRSGIANEEANKFRTRRQSNRDPDSYGYSFRDVGNCHAVVPSSLQRLPVGQRRRAGGRSSKGHKISSHTAQHADQFHYCGGWRADAYVGGFQQRRNRAKHGTTDSSGRQRQ